MKKINVLLILLFLIGVSCEKKKTIWAKNANVTVKFTHHWDGIPISRSDFNIFKFTNKIGNELSIERLRYVISKIMIDDKIVEYNLVDLTNNTGLEMLFEDVSVGIHSLDFVFGLSSIDGAYKDLNTSSFNVPAALGGGYHFMQFDGKFINEQKKVSNFNYHMIRAVDSKDPQNLIFEDTSFSVNLGQVAVMNESVIAIKMNLAAWFKDPVTWNLNKLNSFLMPNFEAQRTMRMNGTTVFSLGGITAK